MIGYMEATIRRNGDIIFFREINIEDGSHKGVRPAMLGWFTTLHNDVNRIPQAGDPEEILEVSIEYKITCDALQEYIAEFKVEGKRKYTRWALQGLHTHLHREIESFIKSHFV